MSVVAEAEDLVFRLSDNDRAALVGKILRSLPSPSVAEDDDWVNEAMRRSNEMNENPETVLSEEEFLSSLREYVRR